MTADKTAIRPFQVNVPEAELIELCRRINATGHFAAWEQPQLFSEEVRAGLRSLRK